LFFDYRHRECQVGILVRRDGKELGWDFAYQINDTLQLIEMARLYLSVPGRRSRDMREKFLDDEHDLTGHYVRHSDPSHGPGGEVKQIEERRRAR
jgi:hypothetical protein